MKPSFVSGLGVALGLALLSGALLQLIGPSDAGLRVAVTAVAGLYVLWLVGTSDERVGRVTSVVTWTALTAVFWLAVPQTAAFVVLQLVLIWTVRSLFFHNGALVPMLDLGLIAAGLGGALWALAGTASLPMAVWTFFLVQALFVWIPGPNPARPSDVVDPFAAAQRSADRALRRLARRI